MEKEKIYNLMSRGGYKKINERNICCVQLLIELIDCNKGGGKMMSCVISKKLICGIMFDLAVMQLVSFE